MTEQEKIVRISEMQQKGEGEYNDHCPRCGRLFPEGLEKRHSKADERLMICMSCYANEAVSSVAGVTEPVREWVCIKDNWVRAELGSKELKRLGRAERFKELDRMAFEFSAGKVNDLAVYSLDFEDTAYVLGSAYLYFLYKLGAVSKEKCVKAKGQLIKAADHIHNELFYARIMYERYRDMNLKYSAYMNELYRQVREQDPDALKTALDVVDILSGDNIFGNALCISKRMGLSREAVKAMLERCEAVNKDECTMNKAMDFFDGWITQLAADGTLECFEALSEDDVKALCLNVPEKITPGTDIPRNMLP